MSAKRQRLFGFGMRGARVIGFAQTLRSGAKVVTVEWREAGQRETQSWAFTAEGRRLAKAFADGTSERLARRTTPQAARLTLHELHDRYTTAKDHELRPATKQGYAARWGIFTTIVGEREFADLVTADTLDEVRKKLRTEPRGKTGAPMAANQIRETLGHVKTVFRWGARRKLLRENPLADYENTMGKNVGALEVPEYTPDEYQRIVAALDPFGARTWRAYGVIALDGLTGKRESAVLQLKWDDIDLAHETIAWPKETDKLGEAWDQPMAADTIALLAFLRQWRDQIGYTGPYVFPPANARNRRGHYTADSVIKALHGAEQRAGVATIKYRALHSIKRYVVRTLHDVLGGDLMRVGRFVGNKSPGVMRKSYLRARAGDLQTAADALMLPRTTPESATPHANERQTPSVAKKSTSRKSR